MTIAGAYARIANHEQICAMRYGPIFRFLWGISAGVALIVVGLLAWMAVQLYSLQPLRVAAAQQQGRGAGASYAPASHPN